MNRARRLALALGAAALVAATAAPAAAAPGEGNVLREHRRPAGSMLEEDDPRWECWRHGNRACGATVTDPRSGAEIAVVVQYDRRGRIASVRLG